MTGGNIYKLILLFNILVTFIFPALMCAQTKSSRVNPGMIRDRFKNEIYKPIMPEAWVNQYKQPYSEYDMEYCNPNICEYYFRVVCGLNRRTMTFKLFQSGCHLQLNNKCANHWGTMKYDMIELGHCQKRRLRLRSGCNFACDTELDLVCAISNQGQAKLFLNPCKMDAANCEGRSEFDQKITYYQVAPNNNLLYCINWINFTQPQHEDNLYRYKYTELF